MSADTPQSAPTGVFLYKYGCLYPAADFYRGISTQYGCLYPAASSHRGISAQIWVPVPRSQLLPGYFYSNMGACTPQPTFTGVFLRKYGCLYPAASSHRGISAQIRAPIPHSQLSLGYFYTNMGAYTPALLPPYQNFHTLSCKFSTFSQFHFNSRNIQKTRIPLQSGDAGFLTLCIRIIHSYLRASSPGRLRCRHQ